MFQSLGDEGLEFRVYVCLWVFTLYGVYEEGLEINRVAEFPVDGLLDSRVY